MIPTFGRIGRIVLFCSALAAEFRGEKSRKRFPRATWLNSIPVRRLGSRVRAARVAQRCFSTFREVERDLAGESSEFQSADRRCFAAVDFGHALRSRSAVS